MPMKSYNQPQLHGMFVALTPTKSFFLGDGYNYWGIELIRKLRDPDYQGTARFPYNTLCDMWLRRLGSNQHRYTIQCTMSVNLFNEKVCISYSK